MKNPRITHKEINLIKGKINSVFSRSELRRKVLEAGIILGHTDSKRPRVKTWVRCNICKKPEAISYIDVDHVSPKVPTHSTFIDHYKSMDDYIDACWCSEDNLQNLCQECHDAKTTQEAAERRKLKKEKKNESK